MFQQIFFYIFIFLKNQLLFFFIIWFFILYLHKKYEWHQTKRFLHNDSITTQSLSVTSVNSIWRTTIFEYLAWAIKMKMWTRDKTIYSSSLQLHHSSGITYSSHSQMWHWSFFRFVNRILSLWFMTRSFSHEAGKRLVALWKIGSSLLGFVMITYCLSHLSQSNF